MNSPPEKVMDTAVRLQETVDDISNLTSTRGSYDINVLPRWPALALGAFMILGAVGNTLVCIAICVDRRLQNVTNYFLFSLAAADLLVSLLVMPFSILIELNHGYWHYGSLLCASYTYVDVFLCSASIVHMTIISIDRYLGISRPLKTRNKSKLVVILKIITVWVITTVISCPIIVLAIVKPRDIYQDHICVIDNPYYMIYGSTLAFLIPCLIMAGTYVKTTHLLRHEAVKSGNAIAIGNNYRGSRGSARSDSCDGLRRNHVRHRSFRNNGQERQKTIDSIDDSLFGSQKGLNSPNLILCTGRCSTFSNNNNVNPKITRKCTPTIRDVNAIRTSLPRALMDNVKIHSAAHHRASSGDSPEIGLAMIPAQMEETSAPQSAETFRSKIKERTITLWNKTTRRAASASELANERKATRVLGLVFVCFCICWTPFFAYNFTSAFCRDQCHIPRWMAVIFLWLGYISSTINPIIYTVFNERFRNAFLRILSCQCRRQRPRQDQFARTSGGSSFQAASSATAGAYNAQYIPMEESQLITPM